MEIIYALLPYKDKVLTITTDNGIEFREHALISKRIDTSIYFTDSYCSWQKLQFKTPKELFFKNLMC